MSQQSFAVGTPIRSEKSLFREQLNKDVEHWLAQGNRIDDLGQAQNDRNCRQVRVHSPGHFE